MLFSLSHAIDKAAAIAAVKANPALLNSPKAEQLMQANGLTKEQVLQKMRKKNLGISNEQNNTLSNNIQFQENNATLENNVTKLSDVNRSFMPLFYVSQQKLIKKIQATRQEVKL